MLLLPAKNNRLFFILLLISFCISQISEIDSSKIKNPALAWKASFIPGLGQIYNEKYLKFSLLLSGEVYAINKFNYLNNNDNITKRNTYAWWIVGMYFYSILDAYVDAHLSTFPKRITNNNNDPFSTKTDSIKIEIN